MIDSASPSLADATADARAHAEAFARAVHVVRLAFVNNRVVVNAMEPRAAIGEYDSGTDGLTLWNTSVLALRIDERSGGA